jgi:hypothetical protein
MAIGCLANWLRNRSFHCAITGPLFLIAGGVLALGRAHDPRQYSLGLVVRPYRNRDRVSVGMAVCEALKHIILCYPPLSSACNTCSESKSTDVGWTLPCNGIYTWFSPDLIRNVAMDSHPLASASPLALHVPRMRKRGESAVPFADATNAMGVKLLGACWRSVSPRVAFPRSRPRPCSGSSTPRQRFRDGCLISTPAHFPPKWMASEVIKCQAREPRRVHRGRLCSFFRGLTCHSRLLVLTLLEILDSESRSLRDTVSNCFPGNPESAPA